MKANFWQILGAILLVIGAAGYVYEKFIAPPAKHDKPAVVSPTSAPITAPTTAPLP